MAEALRGAKAKLPAKETSIHPSLHAGMDGSMSMSALPFPFTPSTDQLTTPSYLKKEPAIYRYVLSLCSWVFRFFFQQWLHPGNSWNRQQNLSFFFSVFKVIWNHTWKSRFIVGEIYLEAARNFALFEIQIISSLYI